MNIMTRFLMLCMLLFFTLPVFADAGSQGISPVPAGQEMMCEGPPGGIFGNPAAVNGMLIQEMLQLLSDSLALQEKVVNGLKPEEKKQVLKEIGSLRAKLERLRSEARVMMQAGQPRQCDEKKAGQ